ncbi:MATH and LRR domain-containing protein PFE0570w-like [Teleopsis dalmanni]|uniref:MATH and LRR domain-containing protein PFE0570w-like n=1 Tax=Teleopsis dalmanni TaxID=139649 RepID=UPI0018CD8F2C|nr:MATH and LRR domain-containing protein PFE0570w-like [Teleopsis dalmanni]
MANNNDVAHLYKLFENSFSNMISNDETTSSNEKDINTPSHFEDQITDKTINMCSTLDNPVDTQNSQVMPNINSKKIPEIKTNLKGIETKFEQQVNTTDKLDVKKVSSHLDVPLSVGEQNFYGMECQSTKLYNIQNVGLQGLQEQADHNTIANLVDTSFNNFNLNLKESYKSSNQTGSMLYDKFQKSTYNIPTMEQESFKNIPKSSTIPNEVLYNSNIHTESNLHSEKYFPSARYTLPAYNIRSNLVNDVHQNLQLISNRSLNKDFEKRNVLPHYESIKNPSSVHISEREQMPCVLYNKQTSGKINTREKNTPNIAAIPQSPHSTFQHHIPGINKSRYPILSDLCSNYSPTAPTANEHFSPILLTNEKSQSRNQLLNSLCNNQNSLEVTSNKLISPTLLTNQQCYTKSFIPCTDNSKSAILSDLCNNQSSAHRQISPILLPNQQSHLQPCVPASDKPKNLLFSNSPNSQNFSNTNESQPIQSESLNSVKGLSKFSEKIDSSSLSNPIPKQNAGINTEQNQFFSHAMSPYKTNIPIYTQSSDRVRNLLLNNSTNKQQNAATTEHTVVAACLPQSFNKDRNLHFCKAINSVISAKQKLFPAQTMIKNDSKLSTVDYNFMNIDHVNNSVSKHKDDYSHLIETKMQAPTAAIMNVEQSGTSTDNAIHVDAVNSIPMNPYQFLADNLPRALNIETVPEELRKRQASMGSFSLGESTLACNIQCGTKCENIGQQQSAEELSYAEQEISVGITNPKSNKNIIKPSKLSIKKPKATISKSFFNSPSFENVKDKLQLMQQANLITGGNNTHGIQRNKFCTGDYAKYKSNISAVFTSEITKNSPKLLTQLLSTTSKTTEHLNLETKSHSENKQEKLVNQQNDKELIINNTNSILSQKEIDQHINSSTKNGEEQTDLKQTLSCNSSSSQLETKSDAPTTPPNIEEEPKSTSTITSQGLPSYENTFGSNKYGTSTVESTKANLEYETPTVKSTNANLDRPYFNVYKRPRQQSSVLSTIADTSTITHITNDQNLTNEAQIEKKVASNSTNFILVNEEKQNLSSSLALVQTEKDVQHQPNINNETATTNSLQTTQMSDNLSAQNEKTEKGIAMLEEDSKSDLNVHCEAHWKDVTQKSELTDAEIETVLEGERVEQFLNHAIVVFRKYCETHSDGEIDIEAIEEIASNTVPRQNTMSPVIPLIKPNDFDCNALLLSLNNSEVLPKNNLNQLSSISTNMNMNNVTDISKTSQPELDDIYGEGVRVIENLLAESGVKNGTDKPQKRGRKRTYESVPLLDDYDEDCEEGDVEDEALTAMRQIKRRQANNARERIRIHDLNGALKELGIMCMQILRLNRPLTKLGILRMAVDVITSLEEQVEKRKAALRNNNY